MHSGTGESKFQVECDAGSAGHIRLSAQSLSVTVGQRILRDGALEMWDSVVVSCAQEEDGAMRVCVTGFHLDWDEGREILFVRSHPNDPNTPMLIFDLGPRAEKRCMSGTNASPGRAAFGFLWKNGLANAFVKEFSLDSWKGCLV